MCILTTMENWSLPKGSTSWNLRKAPELSSASLICNVLSYSIPFPFSHVLQFTVSLSWRIFFPPSSLSSFLEDWIDYSSNICIYTLMQLVKFPRVHLVAGGWYLDCSRGFIPKVEEPLYSGLVCFALKVIEQEEEPEGDENPFLLPLWKKLHW